MPSGVNVARGIAQGVQSGVALGNAINDRRANEERVAEERRRYNLALAEAERKSAEQQLAATEEGRLTGERMRQGRESVPGYAKDVEDLAAASITNIVGGLVGGPAGQQIQNIAYLALEQGGTFARTEKYIQHVSNVVGNLQSPEARDRFLREQNTVLELNALESEKRKFEQDLQRDAALGLWASPPNPLQGGGQAQPGQPQGRQEQSGGGGSELNPQLVEGASMALETVEQAFQEAAASGSLEDVRAARGMLRSFRAGFQDAARQTQKQRMIVEDFQGRSMYIQSALQDAYARGDERAIQSLHEQNIQLQSQFSGLMQQGQVPQAPQGFHGEQQQQQAPPPPTREEALAEKARRDAAKQGQGSPKPTAQEVASKALSQADELEARAAAAEQFDPTGAQKLRDEAEKLRTSKEALKPQMELKKREELLAGLSELGVTADPTKSVASAAMTIAEMYRAIYTADSKAKMNSTKNKVRKLFNKGLDVALKEGGAGSASRAISTALTAGKYGDKNPTAKYTLDELIEKWTPFGSFKEAQEAYQAEQSQAPAPEAGPAPPPEAGLAPQAGPAPNPLQATAPPAGGVQTADVEGGIDDLPMGAKGGMAGGMAAGRKGGPNKRQRQK